MTIHRRDSTVEGVKRRVHGLCKVVSIIFAREVETIDLATVAPLVKCRRCLVVLQGLKYRTVYHYLNTRNKSLLVLPYRAGSHVVSHNAEAT